MYTVCASAVISPLRQWLVSYAKTRFKMCHTFKHLFICNTFCCRLILLSLSLYTELALVCCTNPNNVNCFGTIFPNLNFVFASARSILNPTNTEVAQLKGLSPVTRNLCCQSARGNRSGAVRYFPEAVRPRGNTAAPDRFPRAD